jgi:hypothetical protein
MAQGGIKQLGLVKVECDEICTPPGEEGLMQFAAAFSCTGAIFSNLQFQQSSTYENYRNVFFPYSLYALAGYKMARNISSSFINIFKSSILLYEQKIQHSVISNLSRFTVRFERTKTFMP